MGAKEKDTVFGGGLPGRGVAKMKKKLKDKMKEKGVGMSPGAMGGRTPIKTVEDMDLSKMRERVDAIASSIGTGVGGAIGRKLKNKFNKDQFDDGGVVDMTTEVDVE